MHRFKTLTRASLIYTLLLFVLGGTPSRSLLPASALPIKQKTLPPLVKKDSITPQTLRDAYPNSHALIIGINEYTNLPANYQLHYAEQDAKDTAKVLIAKYGFPEKNVEVLLSPKLADIRRSLQRLLDKKTVKEGDRVLVYFSCHGQTVKNNDGGDIGFLIPSDAKIDMEDTGDPAPYSESCLAMSELWSKYLDLCPARHILLIADACYSGLLDTNRDIAADPAELKEWLGRRAKQAMTASEKHTVAKEPSALGHGAFTYYLLEELRGRSVSSTRVFTASELLSVVAPRVHSYTKSLQLPQLGKRNTSGEFLFITGGTSPIPPTNNNNDANGQDVSTLATLHLETTPSGAKVYLDGKPTGKVTPCDVEYDFGLQKTGRLEVGLELSGYKLRVKQYDVVRGQSIRPPVISLELINDPNPNPMPVADRRKEIEDKTGLKLVKIPGGSFDMGSEKRGDEQPVHRVRLDSYWMSENVVTVAQFRKFTESQGYSYDWKKWEPSWGWLDTHPMVNVTWDDAMAYCSWAGVSLPREAEWEYASRGGLQGEEYPWKGGWAAKPGNLHLNGKGTSPVSTSFKNGYGLYDMVGNVWQWCSDRFKENYYKNSPSDNPQGPSTGLSRVQRGGSWLTNDPNFFRCANRARLAPDFRYETYGLRVVFRGLP